MLFSSHGFFFFCNCLGRRKERETRNICISLFVNYLQWFKKWKDKLFLFSSFNLLEIYPKNCRRISKNCSISWTVLVAVSAYRVIERRKIQLSIDLLSLSFARSFSFVRAINSPTHVPAVARNWWWPFQLLSLANFRAIQSRTQRSR